MDEAHRWALLPHCTERTNAPASVADWQRVARRLGVDFRVLPSGCCGMAGLYGHEKANRARSETIYRLSWANHLADPRARRTPRRDGLLVPDASRHRRPRRSSASRPGAAAPREGTHGTTGHAARKGPQRASRRVLAPGRRVARVHWVSPLPKKRDIGSARSTIADRDQRRRKLDEQATCRRMPWPGAHRRRARTDLARQDGHGRRPVSRRRIDRHDRENRRLLPAEEVRQALRRREQGRRDGHDRRYAGEARGARRLHDHGHLAGAAGDRAASHQEHAVRPAHRLRHDHGRSSRRRTSSWCPHRRRTRASPTSSRTSARIRAR